MQNQFNEQELLYIIKNYSKILNLFENQNQKQTQVIILIGVTGAGKSTLFNFLSGAEFEMIGKENQQFLNIKDGAQQFAAIKGGMKSITKSPNYYFSEMYNALLIDFPGFQDTDGKIDQVLIQLLFYQICRSADVKIVYVVKHLETYFNNRGAQLQDFIRQTFQGENLEMSQICLMLNCYNDKLTDDKLIQNVQSQLEQSYKSKLENICVMRKIKNVQDIEQHLTSQKRDFLFTQFLKSNSVIISPQYIPQCELISRYLSEKSEQIFDEQCSILEKELNHKIETLDQEQIIKLEKSLKDITILLKDLQIDRVEWFQELINQLLRLAELLNCQIQTNKSYLNFLTIFKFFAQFSEYITGYDDIKHNGIIAQEKSDFFIKIFSGKIALLVKQRELLEIQEEKKMQAQERQKAEQNSQLQSQLAQQAQQSLQQQQSLHQNTQNAFNKGIQEIHEYKLQQEKLVYQNKLLEANHQRQQEDNIKIVKELEQSNNQYNQQLNTFNTQSETMKNEFGQLNTKFQEIQNQNLSENEKYKIFFDDLLKNNEKLQKLEQNQFAQKEELNKFFKDCNNDMAKLAQQVECLAENQGGLCSIF